jgi:hypothetical protein
MYRYTYHRIERGGDSRGTAEGQQRDGRGTDGRGTEEGRQRDGRGKAEGGRGEASWQRCGRGHDQREGLEMRTEGGGGGEGRAYRDV